MAPEVLVCPLKDHPDENKEVGRLHYNSSVDAWAVGCLAYELVRLFGERLGWLPPDARRASPSPSRPPSPHPTAAPRQPATPPSVNQSNKNVKTVGFPPFIAERAADIQERIARGEASQGDAVRRGGGDVHVLRGAFGGGGKRGGGEVFLQTSRSASRAAR